MINPDQQRVRVLEALDPIPAWLVERAAPLRIEVAVGEREREALYRLRYAFVRRAGWDVGEGSTSELERDGWDEDAVHLAAWDGGTLAGTCRMVFPDGRRRLPVEVAFGITVEPAGRVVEPGRQIVVERYRGDPLHRVSLALMGRAWLEARRRGYQVWTASMAAPIVTMCQRLGFTFEVLAPAGRVLGEERLPIRCDMVDSAAGVAAACRQFGAPEMQAVR